MKSKCRICGDFKDKESAFQKYGSEENDTCLPENANKLQLIKDLKPGSNRLKQLKQCPECKTYYLYETDYEYFAFGSEDEQVLTRLTGTEAMELLNSL
ncbi:MAG TPA: hypothetical protein PK986_01630 [Spirochaetota bacterium]|nr:hypothetical protein [Spirochaetota bacterium]HQO39144.1 hypothetical protein [Spirochaetota bacterium]